VSGQARGTLRVMALGDEKYLLLTKFKRDGTGVETPVWAVPLDREEIGFWTSSGCWSEIPFQRCGSVMPWMV